MRHLLTIALLLAATTVSAQVPTSGLRVHLKADAGTSTTVENAGVSTWTDQSGNGFSATAPAGQPVYQSNAINGMPALFFNGAQYLHIANTSTLGLVNSDYEMFFVAKSSNLAIQFLASGGLPEHEAHLNGDAGFRFIPRWPLVFADNGANQAFTDGVQRIFGVRASSTSGVARVNGVDAILAANAHSSLDAMFRLGMRSDGSFALNGHIAEVLIYNRTLSAQERAQVENYLAQKYAIASNNLILPTASIEAPTTSQNLSASFSGTVNPNGVATSVRFAYGTDPNNLTQLTNPVAIGSGTSAVPVSAAVSGLSRFQTYHVKLIASTDFQTVETGQLSFETNYLDVVSTSVGITGDAGETSIFVLAELTVPTTGGSEYKIRFGSFETEFAPADTLSGTFNIEQALPNDDLEFGTTYDVTIIGKGPTGQLTYGDTLSIRYIGYPTAQLTSLTPLQTGEVIVSGTVNPNGSETSYIILYGTAHDDLSTSTNPVSIGDGIAAVSITDTLALAIGTTYWFRLVGTDGDDLTGSSDTLSVSTSFAVASIDSVTVTRTSDITFHGRVNPTSLETSIRYRYGSSRSALDQATQWETISLIDIIGGVTRAIPMLPFGSQYYVVLEADNGVNIARSDTVAFDTKFVAVESFGLSLTAAPSPQISATISIDTFDTDGAEYQLLFGTESTNLEPVSDFQAVGTQPITASISGNDLTPGATYYVAVQARSATGKTAISSIESIRFAGLPIAVLDTVVATQDFTAYFNARINPNGGDITYVLQFGTDRNNLDQIGPLQTFEGNGTSFVSELAELSEVMPAAIFYATLVVTNSNYPPQRSDTLSFDMRYAILEYFNPDVVSPTDVLFYLGMNPYGYDKSGTIQYGAHPNNLNRSFTDPASYTGTSTVSRTHLLDAFSPDSTYYARWMIEDLNGGPTTYSEIVEFNTFFPSASLDSVSTISNLVLGVHATLDTKNQSTTVKLRYTDSNGSSFSDFTGITFEASTEPVNIVIPLTMLDIDDEYEVSFELVNASGNSVVTDTLSIDTYFVRYYQPTVSFSGADVAVRAELQAQPDLEYAYRILRGTRADSLVAVGDFVSVTTSERYTDIEEVLSADDFILDNTYYFAIEGRGTSGWISRSDTLSLTYRALAYATRPVALIDSVVFGFSEIPVTLGSTIFPNGRNVSYQFWVGTHPDSLVALGSATDVASSVDSLVASLQLTNLDRFKEYFVSVSVLEQGQPTAARTDTVSFTTDVPYLYAYDAYTFIDFEDEGQIVGILRAYVDTNDLDTYVRVVYGTDPDNLTQSTTPQLLPAMDDQEQIDADVVFGPLQPNTTYYARMELSNASNTTSTYNYTLGTTFPDIDLVSVQINPEGSAYIMGNITRNGLSGQYGIRYGTNPDSLNQEDTPRYFSNLNNEQFEAGFSLNELTLGQTYYAYLYVNSDQSAFNRTRVFAMNFAFPSVDTSMVVTRQDLTASVVAYIDTKGQDVSFWVRTFNAATSSWMFSDTLSVAGSTMSEYVSVELGSFARFSSNVLVLALQTEGGPVIYADTTYFNFNYVGIADAAIARRVANDQPVFDVTANLTVRVDEPISYRILFGEDGGTLTEIGDATDITPDISSFALTSSIPTDNLVVGTTYAAVIWVDYGDYTTFSDTLRITHSTRPEIASFTVNTFQDLSATYSATITSNGSEGTYRVLIGYDPYSMTGSNEGLPIGDGSIQNADLGTFQRYLTLYAVLAVETDDFSTVYSDTLSFSTSYPQIASINPNFGLASNNHVIVDMSVLHPNLPAMVTARYGYAPDSLIYEGDPWDLAPFPVSQNTSYWFGPVVRNDTLHFQVGVTYDGLTTWSDVQTFYTIGHEFTFGTPTLTSTGGGKFRAEVKVVLDPKGMSSSVLEFIATSADFSDGTTNGDVPLASSEIQELNYVFEDLVIGQTYYLKVEAYDNQTYQVSSSSGVLEIAFDTTPLIENLALQSNPDLSIGLSGTLYPFNSDLTYHVAYGQDRNNLSLRTDSVTVSADSSTVVIDQRIANLERFSTWHAVVVIEREGYAPLRSDTLSATLAFPTFVFGSPSTAANGDVSVPLTIDNGGFDTNVWLAGLSADTTAVDGSNEPVPVTIVIPNPGVGVQLDIIAVADTDGLISRSDTLRYTTNAPDFTLVRAFARQDYKAILQASVNPNGIATQIRFEWGAFGTFNRASPNIDLGGGTDAIDTTFISTQDLSFNADHVARLVVFGEGFEFISNTIHFNARIPGIGINDIRVISSDSVVVSVQINSQGIDTYARLVYGPVGSGYPDTTVAVARTTDENVQLFDMTLTGLASSTQYQVKLLVQDQADLNKIVVSNAYTFTTPVGTDVNFAQTAGTAIRFDGQNSRLQFQSTSVMSTTSTYTIQMWFKTDDANTPVQFLSSKGMEYMELHLTGGNRSLRFIPRDGAYFDTPSNTIQSGVWTHVSATYDHANQSVKVYLNGVDMPLTTAGFNSGSPFIGQPTSSSELYIGRRSDYSFSFAGEIDEIRLWNTSRTPLQVWDDMHNTTPSEFNPSLVMYAQLNQGSGEIVSDVNNGVTGWRYEFGGNESWVPSTAPINGNARYSAQLTGQAGWRFLSSPVPTTVGNLLSGIWTQGFAGATTSNGAPHVFTWNIANASNSAGNWTPVTSGDQEIAPGDGLFVYVYDGAPGTTGTWPKTLSVTGQASRTAPSLSSRLNPNADGWALVGNPYSTDISWGDLSRSGLYNAVYSWNPNAEEWATWNGTTGGLANGRIGAFNAFLVATMSESPSLSVPFNARRAGTSQFLGKIVESQAATFSLQVEGPDGRTNKAWFSFDANGKLGLDAYDALKLAPYSANYVQLASVVSDSIRLDINHLPILTEEVTIPLRVKSTANGTYRLSLSGNALPSGWDFAVIDTQTGESSKLAQPIEFAWTGGGKELSRYVLKLSPNTITSTERGPDAPFVFALGQNYPNPFNPSTVIRYTLDAGRPTSLKVYDVLGREVAVLVDGVMSPGTHSVTFDGSGLASGVYLYRLESGGKVLSRKFTLIK